MVAVQPYLATAIFYTLSQILKAISLEKHQ